MEVYLENCYRGKGIWTKVPQPVEMLKQAIQQVSEAGEYQLSRIRINNFDVQVCVGNLFTLNKKLFRYEQLSEEEKQQILEYSYDSGLSFEETLYQLF